MEVAKEPLVTVNGVTKHFVATDGKRLTVLEDISFSVAPNEFVSVIGPSGCGKTTLLRILAGLAQADAGEIKVDGKIVSKPGPDRAIVFQDFALLPWLSVVGNVAFPLELRGLPREQRTERSAKAIELVGLKGFEDYYPHMLSGGMQQRVGIARALAADPNTLLMDEPFGALDAQTRHSLQDELLMLWQKHQKTVILITHDMEEAVYLSDRVLILAPRPGRVVQELIVDLPRPRTEAIRRTAHFAELVENVWDILRRWSTE